MAAPPYILAKTLLDAHTFARNELGLGKGHYRVVTSPSSISGRRGTDLYLVPGYEKRHDRFAIAGALKYTRLNKIDVADLRQRETDNIELAERFASQNATRVAVLDALVETLSEQEDDEGLLWVPDGLEPAGEQLTLIDADEATAFFASPIDDMDLDGQGPHGNATTMSLEEALAIAKQAEEPAKRIRRRRCEECGSLVLPDEFDQHVADHLPTGE